MGISAGCDSGHIEMIPFIRAYDHAPECLGPPIVAHSSVMSYDLKVQMEFCLCIGAAISPYKHNKFGTSESEWVGASVLR